MLKSINLIKTKPKNIIFNSKALDFINLPKLLRTPNIRNQSPESVDITESPMVVYTLTKPIRTKTCHEKEILYWHKYFLGYPK